MHGAITVRTAVGTYRFGMGESSRSDPGTTPATDWQVEDFLASLTSVAPATRRAYAGDLESFIRWFDPLGAHGPLDVDRAVLRRWLAHLTTEGYARRTLARRASTLRRYFTWLGRSGQLPSDPTTALKAPGGTGRLPRVLTPEELDVLLSPPAGEENPAVRCRDDAVIELLYGAGLRVAELCGLALGDLDAAAGLVTVTGKGSRQRRVPVGEPALDAVARWVAEGRPAMVSDQSPPDALFLNRRGRRLGPRDVRRIIDRRAPLSLIHI